MDTSTAKVVRTMPRSPFIVNGTFQCPRRDAVVSIKEVRTAVCDYFGLGERALISRARNWHVVKPRQIAMYLCRKLTPYSDEVIGRKFGSRDTSTIWHGAKTIEALLLTTPWVQDAVEAIEWRLRGSR